MGLLVSFDLSSRCLVACVKHFEFVSGFLMALLKQLVIILWMKSKEFNQKLGTLSIPGDSHFWNFQRAFFRSSTIISSHTCSSNPLHLFSSLLSHSGFLLYSFCIPQIRSQKFYTSSLVGGFITFTCFLSSFL